MVPALLISLACAAAVELPEKAAPASGAVGRVPRALIERVEGEFRVHTKRPADEPVKHALLDLIIEVHAEREGVLNEEARWRLKPGGDVFDFAPLVGARPGRFNVRFAARDGAGVAVEPARVYFVPRGRRRELDGESFGDGCDKILDLTGAFRKRFAARGFDVFSAAQRYVSTLSGTFLVAAFDQKVLQVGHVTFTDSRWANLQCE